MNFNDEEYLPRLVDKTLEDFLSVFGAVSVEGPKWCGKTWTSFKHAKSSIFLDDEEVMEKALLDLELVLDKEAPELIDEWRLVPKIWDRVRRKCDKDSSKGKYILTCSTELTDKKKMEIFHSGAGRIGKLKMYPMSLFESGDSNGMASLQAMKDGTQKNVNVDIPSLKELSYFIIRGGWPSNLKVEANKCEIIPKSYIDSILDKDINDDKKRDRNKMLMLLKSLARNESTFANGNTLLKDIVANETSSLALKSRITLQDYLDVLDRLHILENQDAYSENYRSPTRVGKSPKRHFTDPSLACACLNLTSEKLLNDLKTFGFMFESLVERDLRIYIEYLGGHLYHFRDNVTGLEVDSILEFSNGDYAAIEIKLGYDKVDEAKTSLQKFYNNMNVKPVFMCIITGNFSAIVKDSETGIYIIPITALKP